jgi:hypothetical protein
MESKQVRDLLEAYAAVYEQSMLDPVVDTATSVVKPPVQRQANKKYGPLGGFVAGREVDKIGSDVKSGNYGGALNRAMRGAGKLFNSVDVFDIVKGHLLDEGFADTEEAALAIMVNMSEGWKESITEGLSDVLPKSKITVPGKYGKNTVLSKKGGKPPFPGARGNVGGVEGVSDKSKPGSFTPIPGGFTPAQSTRYNQRGGQ